MSVQVSYPNLIRKSLSVHAGIIEGESWYQGDHMIFVLNQLPALAFTSEKAMENLATITHTPRTDLSWSTGSGWSR